jgi:hypothetical protein
MRAQHSDRAAVGIYRSLMPDGISPAGHSADDDEATRGQVLPRRCAICVP